MLATGLLAACNESLETEPVDLPVQFVVPVSSQQLTPRRIAGDPGFAESLELPHYAYVFIVFKAKSGREEIRSIVGTDLYDGGKTDTEVWEKVDTAYTGGDIVYRCKVTFKRLTPVLGTLDYCRVYAAMSKQPLTLSNTDPSSEDAVKNITFTVTDELQEDIHNVYSTPYNYKVGDKYYGDINVWSNAPRANLMLYHVAAKIDLKWNVPEDKRSLLRVTGMSTRNLFKGESFLFRPTGNVHEEFTAADGYTPAAPLLGDVAGTWWAGRTYFYTIPYKTSEGKFPLHVDVNLKNVSEGNTYTDDLKLTITNPEVFVPWVRGQLSFTTALTADKSETIYVD